MKKILLISTGGTISQEKDDSGITKSSESKTADAFTTYLNTLNEQMHLDLSITPKAILNKDSSNIIPTDWTKMADTIVEEYDNYDVFIISHGTNTLGYTAAALSFALGNLGKPVILTGAQVPIGYLGSDATMNLENTIRLIVQSPYPLAGVIAVVASYIITGTRVKKTNEYDYEAFKAFNQDTAIGRIGRTIKINEDSLNNHLSFLAPMAKTKEELEYNTSFNNNIISLTEFPGLKSDNIYMLADKGIKGVILRGTGAGDVNVSNENYENLKGAFEYLREKQIPIIVTTQAPDGIASMDVNEP
jgi:L-asparaginase